jgi:predicted nucleic acid-binding protein
VATLTFYLDTSVVIPLLKPEALSDRADRFIGENPANVIVSDFAAAEFASAAGRWVRSGEISMSEGHIALESFDGWVARSVRRVEISPADVATASAFMRRLDLPLRTPDAIHIAIAQRLGATLVTFDRRMAASARALGALVATT